MNEREKVKKIIESEEVPEYLRPENIGYLLKKQNPLKSYSKKTYKMQYIRIMAGLAVCAVFSTIGIYNIEKKAPKNFNESVIDSENTSGNINGRKNTEIKSYLKTAESYDEIHEVFSEASKHYNNIQQNSFETDSAFFGGSERNNINKLVTDNKSIFSVGEKDSFIDIASVKDGEFLYSYSMDIVSGLSDILDSEVCGIYITDNKLIVISENLINDGNTVTTILAYNIAYQDEKPLLAYLGEYSQSGNFSDIKINSDYICIITSETKDLSEKISTDDYEKYLPEYYINGEKYYPEPENIYIPSDMHEINSEELNTGFTTAGVLKINHDYGNINTDRNGDIFIQTDIKAFAKSAEFVYCSENNLYVTVSNYSNAYTENTDIFRFSLSEGNINPEANQNIKGIPLNQSSMNEYDGFFRIATEYEFVEEEYTLDTGETVQNFVHKKYDLYVLDSDMNTVGVLEDFGENYNINVVKFFENTAYVLSYDDQSEPLLTIDLTDFSKNSPTSQVVDKLRPEY